MSKQIVPDEAVRQWVNDWSATGELRPALSKYIANRAAAWAFEQAATVCDENGRSDGHTCAKEIRAMIGGQENGS
jgi:hypothetical protein